MANIINNNFHNLKLNLNKDEYWDFFLNKDSLNSYYFESENMYDKCLISYIDVSMSECVSDMWLYGSDKYKWGNCFSTNYTLKNIGYTGIDNGLIRYRRDKITNKDFFEIFTGSTFVIEDDCRLKLHSVSGTHLLHDYSYEFMEDKVKLNGGFFQGFFETECDKYSILPKKLEQGDTWEFEFILNKEEFEETAKNKLNDIHPNNKGFFFYIGARAENKWIYLYDMTKPTCTIMGMDDYAEGVDFDATKYKMNNLIDPNPTDWIREEQIAMDDYLSYKYYDKKLYEEIPLEEDDFFLDDYLIMDTQPTTIDEEKNDSISLKWCCKHTKQKEEEVIGNVCCGCGSCDPNKELEDLDAINGTYLSNSYLFGDDYLEDDKELDNLYDFIEYDIDISEFEYETFLDNFKLHVSHQYFFDTKNQFLMFDRTCDGFNVHNYTSDSFIRYYGVKNSFNGNLFLLLNRTCTGYTVNNIKEFIESHVREYNIYDDIYDNALGFRIKDDGSIGYRYYTLDCDSETQTTIREGYSKSGIIKDGEWHIINVKITAYENTMVLRFYVDGYLVFVTDEMRKLKLRPLNEVYEKQEGVPFNISLGGGTQGLIDTVTPNYMLDPYRVYPLEENFAGTFIGYIKSFKFYNCSREYLDIYNNFKFESNKLRKN